MKIRTHARGYIGSLFTALMCLGSAASIHAAIIFDTFGPDPYTPGINSHYLVWEYGSFSGVGGGRSISTPFSFAGSAYQLSSITLDIRLAGNEISPNLEIGIYPDAGGRPALTPVANLLPNPTFVTAQRQALTYSFGGVHVLAPDTPYWMVFQPHTFAVASESYNAAYYISSSTFLPNGGVAVRTLPFPDSSEWTAWTYYNAPSPVFRLEGLAVPEPGTWTLFALGGGALLWQAARRRGK